MKFKRIAVLGACIAVLIAGIATYFYFEHKPEIIQIDELIPERTQQELILNSDIIVSGTVTTIGDGKWSNPDFKIKGKNNIIQTDITVAADELLSGSYDKNNVVVRIKKATIKKATPESFLMGIRISKSAKRSFCSFPATMGTQ